MIGIFQHHYCLLSYLLELWFIISVVLFGVPVRPKHCFESIPDGYHPFPMRTKDQDSTCDRPSYRGAFKRRWVGSKGFAVSPTITALYKNISNLIDTTWNSRYMRRRLLALFDRRMPRKQLPFDRYWHILV